jgi:serine phosphatase RsbU (regulator of sigma subunit)
MLAMLIGNLTQRGRLGALVGELNRALQGCVRDPHSGLFATAFFLTLDDDGSVAYSSAAHPPVLLRREGGRIEELPSLSRPIGLFAETTYDPRELRLGARDCLLLYTDGLIEAQGTDGEAFGLDRLRRLLAETPLDPRALTRAIYDEVCRRQNIDELEDDVTFLVARR